MRAGRIAPNSEKIQKIIFRGNVNEVLWFTARRIVTPTLLSLCFGLSSLVRGPWIMDQGPSS